METIELEVKDITLLPQGAFVFDTVNYCVVIGPSTLVAPITKENVYLIVNKLTGIVEAETRVYTLAVTTTITLNSTLLTLTSELEKISNSEFPDETPSKTKNH